MSESSALGGGQGQASLARFPVPRGARVGVKSTWGGGEGPGLAPAGVGGTLPAQPLGKLLLRWPHTPPHP